MKKQDFRIGAPEEINDCTFTAPTSEYKFSCWNTKADGSGESYNNHEKFCIDSADVVLYAIWILGNYEISYGNVFDATDNNVKTYTVNDDVSLVAPGARTGLTFDGWYTTSDFKDGT